MSDSVRQQQIERFEQAIAEAEKAGATAGVDPRLHQAMVDGMKAQLDELHGDDKVG